VRYSWLLAKHAAAGVERVRGQVRNRLPCRRSLRSWLIAKHDAVRVNRERLWPQLCQLCQLCQRWHNWHSSTVFVPFHARFRVRSLVGDRTAWLCTARCSNSVIYLAQRTRQFVSLGNPLIYSFPPWGRIMTDERLNKHAAAEHLSKTVHVSPRTLDAWRAADRGPRSRKIAGRVFWFKSDLDQWLTAEFTSTARGGVR